jgi:hypothetical protein
LASGDTVYFGPGTYRELVQLTNNWTSQVSFIGDTGNSQGFKNSSGVLLAPALCRLTAFTTSDSVAAAVTANTIDLNGKNYFKLANFLVEGCAQTGTGKGPLYAQSVSSTNIALLNCTFIGTEAAGVAIIAAASTTLNWTIDNCILWSTTSGLSVQWTSVVGSDWDMNIVVRNSYLFGLGVAGIGGQKSGSNGGVGGGIYCTNCTILSGVTAVSAGASSTNNFKMFFRNCIMYASSKALQSQDVGQVDEDYNALIAQSSYILGPALGAHSHTNDFNPALIFGATQQQGMGMRPMFSLPSYSPYIGAGVGNVPSTDLFGKTRPNPNSVGAFETYTAPEHSSVFGQ